MGKQIKEVRLSRRRFLKGAGGGLSAAGVAATALCPLPSPVEAAAEKAPTAGYRETEHVKRVYALARF